MQLADSWKNRSKCSKNNCSFDSSSNNQRLNTSATSEAERSKVRHSEFFKLLLTVKPF